jgi:RES domain-containing protein
VFRPLTGRFWRAVFVGEEDYLLKPARGRFGRWHYEGQPALYCSDDPEGCRVSINSFAKPNDPERRLFPIEVSADRIVDLCDETTRGSLGVSLSDIHAFWNEYLANGQVSPTWVISDQLRDLGAQGLLSPSRSKPHLTHLTLFSWNAPGCASVKARLEQSIPF